MFETGFGYCKVILAVLLVFSIGFVLMQFIFTNDFESKNQNSADDELIFAHTICRHGDRNMYESFPTNPRNSEIYWQGGFAALTKVGKRQHYELGQYLAKRYSKLIGNGEYSPNKIYVRSTDVDRVLMSAQATMAGLFPPQGKQKWHPNINWQPIPVHTVPSDQDYIIGLDSICARADYEMNKYQNSTEFRTLLSERKSLIDYLEENTGRVINTLQQLSFIYDDLFVERIKGYRMPSWVDEVMQPGGDLEYLAKFYMASLTPTTELKKLRAGFLLKEMLDQFTEKVNLTLSPDRSLWMYFAHDTTIAVIINSLGLFEPHGPPYASCVFFELFKSNTDNYVQVFYRNSSEFHVPAMEIPNCGTKCPLAEFYNLYLGILPTKTPKEECYLEML